MKLLYCFAFVLFSLTGFAQLPGKRVKESAVLPGNIVIAEGDTIVMGVGSMANRSFAYATHGGLVLTGEPLDRGFANAAFPVQQVRHLNNARFGSNYYAVIQAGPGKVLVEFPVSVETGEVKQIKSVKAGQ